MESFCTLSLSVNQGTFPAIPVPAALCLAGVRRSHRLPSSLLSVYGLPPKAQTQPMTGVLDTRGCGGAQKMLLLSVKWNEAGAGMKMCLSAPFLNPGGVRVHLPTGLARKDCRHSSILLNAFPTEARWHPFRKCCEVIPHFSFQNSLPT